MSPPKELVPRPEIPSTPTKKSLEKGEVQPATQLVFRLKEGSAPTTAAVPLKDAKNPLLAIQREMPIRDDGSGFGPGLIGYTSSQNEEASNITTDPIAYAERMMECLGSELLCHDITIQPDLTMQAEGGRHDDSFTYFCGVEDAEGVFYLAIRYDTWRWVRRKLIKKNLDGLPFPRNIERYFEKYHLKMKQNREKEGVDWLGLDGKPTGEKWWPGKGSIDG